MPRLYNDISRTVLLFTLRMRMIKLIVSLALKVFLHAMCSAEIVDRPHKGQNIKSNQNQVIRYFMIKPEIFTLLAEPVSMLYYAKGGVTQCLTHTSKTLCSANLCDSQCLSGFAIRALHA